jgi:hypothetical protein
MEVCIILGIMAVLDIENTNLETRRWSGMDRQYTPDLVSDGIGTYVVNT